MSRPWCEVQKEGLDWVRQRVGGYGGWGAVDQPGGSLKHFDEKGVVGRNSNSDNLDRLKRVDMVVDSDLG